MKLNQKMQKVEMKKEIIMSERLNDFLDAVGSGSFNKAKEMFDDELSDRMNDALEAEKINIADQIFNGGSEESEEEIVDDIVVDEIEDEYEEEVEFEDEDL